MTSSCVAPEKMTAPPTDNIGDIVDNIKTKEELKIVTDYKLQNLLNYVVVGSLALVGGCIVLFLIKGSMTGILGSIAGITVLILALVIKTYMAILALSGLVVLIGLLVIAVIYLLRDKDAFKQVIQSFDKVKEEIRAPDVKTRIKANVNAIQTDATQKLVRETKEKLVRKTTGK